MSAPGFTPGEWLVQARSLTVYTITRGVTNAIAVACRSGVDRGSEVSPEAAKANARLMAAAPKLYEAADILQANAVTAPDLRMAGATDCYLVTLDDMEALRAALAAARGEAPHA